MVVTSSKARLLIRVCEVSAAVNAVTEWKLSENSADGVESRCERSRREKCSVQRVKALGEQRGR